MYSVLSSQTVPKFAIQLQDLCQKVATFRVQNQQKRFHLDVKVGSECEVEIEDNQMHNLLELFDKIVCF